jgi:hypothetical protein
MKQMMTRAPRAPVSSLVLGLKWIDASNKDLFLPQKCAQATGLVCGKSSPPKQHVCGSVLVPTRGAVLPAVPLPSQTRGMGR